MPDISRHEYFRLSSEEEKIWFSSGAYVFAIFGFLGIFLLLLGTIYVGFMSFCLLVMLLFSAHILSIVFVIYLCMTLRMCYVDDQQKKMWLFPISAVRPIVFVERHMPCCIDLNFL